MQANHSYKSAFQLLETLLLENGEYSLLEHHILRLMDSAAYFGFHGDEEQIRRELAAHAAAYSEPRRVRLLLDADGRVQVESQPYIPLEGNEFPVALAQRPISKEDVFLRHKTTNRHIYEDCKQGAGDVFDVLLWNEDDEITEFTIGNLVAKIGGCMVTPPLHCGMLPGTMRASLLASGVIEERTIRRDEIRAAESLWLINSLRGWIPVYLSGGD
ncbi:aminotransferase class IV [Paenibacillus oenotherae]|uniref:Aminotransferase class IV n=1 Tax=Paenibacillus oenotherae TaxID=1435645 RepID=A0ABS7D1G1_9BACL|nr:aminotransferase class IV [Paenibacillus oenotherae]MBW7473780.1 aminotransferase class IV [Paenibacillus oenotherae]